MGNRRTRPTVFSRARHLKCWFAVTALVAAFPGMLLAANVTIDAGNAINTVPTNAFGIFMAVWESWGTGTAAPIRQAGVTAMRYPGGGYADNYHWSSDLMTGFDGIVTN